MRVNPYNVISQIYKPGKSGGVKKTDEYRGQSEKDEFQISSFGRDYQLAKKAVADAPEVREDLVSAMKAKYGSGSGNVDTADFASVLMEKYAAAV